MVADFNKKVNRGLTKDKLFFKALGSFFIIVLCVLIFWDVKIYQKKKELMVEISNYNQQIEDIQKNNQTLQYEIDNADSRDYLEKLGYEQLNQTRPGETEYMFVKSANKPETVQSMSAPKNFLGIFSSWLSQSWGWIKSKF